MEMKEKSVTQVTTVRSDNRYARRLEELNKRPILGRKEQISIETNAEEALYANYRPVLNSNFQNDLSELNSNNNFDLIASNNVHWTFPKEQLPSFNTTEVSVVQPRPILGRGDLKNKQDVTFNISETDFHEKERYELERDAEILNYQLNQTDLEQSMKLAYYSNDFSTNFASKVEAWSSQSLIFPGKSNPTFDTYCEYKQNLDTPQQNSFHQMVDIYSSNILPYLQPYPQFKNRVQESQKLSNTATQARLELLQSKVPIGHFNNQ